jgi:TolB protein
MTSYWRDAGRANTPSELVATVLADQGHSGTLSPDGRTFAYVDDRNGEDIWVRQVAGGAPVRVTSDRLTKGHLKFSPAGDTIFFTRTEPQGRTLRRVATLGGGERKLLDDAERPAPSPDGARLAFVRGGVLMVGTIDGSDALEIARGLEAPNNSGPAWSRDGRYLSFVKGQLFTPYNLFIVELTTGRERQVTRFDRAGQGIHSHAWLPDGAQIVAVYDPTNDTSQSRFDLGVVGVADGNVRRLLPAIGDGFSEPTLSTDGDRLIVTRQRIQRDLWKVPYGADPDASGAAAVRIRDGSGDPMWSSVSRDQKMVLFSASSVGVRNLWTMAVDAPAETRQITTIRDAAVSHSAFSADGRRVVFASSARGPNDIWIQDLDGSNLRQLTNDVDADSWPTFSPEDDRVFYTSTRDGVGSGRVISIKSVAPEKIMDGFWRGDWVRSRSGKSWLVANNGANLVRLVDMDTRATVWEVKMPVPLGMPVFSPDRLSISVPDRDPSNRTAIYVFDAATGRSRLAVRLPFAATFRAGWIDAGRGFVVNRQLRTTSTILFENFLGAAFRE